MGLIQAGLGAFNGVMADQWKEFFYCDALNADTLVVKGQKRISGRSSNTKGNDNIISNGSRIAVADGQCMIIVEQGKVVEICAQAGEFIWDSSTEPSIFTGSFGEGVKELFKKMAERFTFGGDPGKDQRVYYMNTKEIIDNKFGTANPFMFRVVNNRAHMDRTVNVRCNGVFSYKITNPVLFYTQVCGNVEQAYERSEIDNQLKTDFISALQPAFARLSTLELRPSDIPAHAMELEDAMAEALRERWDEKRGISLASVSMNPITLTEEDMKKVQQMEDAAAYAQDPNMMAGRIGEATASAMEAAANNPNGAMAGMMGVGMMNNMGGMSVQGLYQQGAQQPAQPANGWQCACGTVATGNFCTNCGAKKPEPKPANGWQCACGTVATGNFCTNCGAKKPEGVRCSNCGWQPENSSETPRFCPDCGQQF